MKKVLFEFLTVAIPTPNERVVHQPVWIEHECRNCGTDNLVGSTTGPRACFVCQNVIGGDDR